MTQTLNDIVTAEAPSSARSRSDGALQGQLCDMFDADPDALTAEKARLAKALQDRLDAGEVRSNDEARPDWLGQELNRIWNGEDAPLLLRDDPDADPALWARGESFLRQFFDRGWIEWAEPTPTQRAELGAEAPADVLVAKVGAVRVSDVEVAELEAQEVADEAASKDGKAEPSQKKAAERAEARAKVEAVWSDPLNQAHLRRFGHPEQPFDEATKRWPCVFAKSGVWEIRASSSGEPPRLVKLGDRLEVLGMAAEGEGREPGLVLRFDIHDGGSDVMKIEILRRSDLASPREVIPHLARIGYRFDGNEKARRLVEILSRVSVAPAFWGRLTRQPGWVGDTFVLPDVKIMRGEARTARELTSPEGVTPVVYDGASTQDRSADAFRTSAQQTEWPAELGRWQDNVARLAIGNSRWSFSLCAAFLGPLMRDLGEDGGGFLIHGSSSSGKTTGLYMAASVHGETGEFLKQASATINALEALCATRNDGLLALDDLQQAAQGSNGDISDAVYRIANGQSKERGAAKGGNRPASSWRLVGLATSEQTLDAIAGRRAAPRVGQSEALAGAKARFAEVPMGQLENLDFADVAQSATGRPAGAVLSDAVKAGARAHYGVPLRVFLMRLTAEGEGSRGLGFWRDWARRRQGAVKALLAKYGEGGGQFGRIASRFAAVVVAGELAALLDVVPLPVAQGLADNPEGTSLLAQSPLWAATTCLNALIEARGGIADAEEMRIIDAIRGAIESRGHCAFDNPNADDDPPEGASLPDAKDRERLGRKWNWRDPASGEVEACFCFTQAGLEAVVSGVEARTAREVLDRAGFLVRGNNHRTKQIGKSKARYTVVRPHIYETAR